jgi:hypothetical protein
MGNYSNRLIWLLFFVFIATIGIWIRGNLFGVDSYATLAAIRFDWFDTLSGQPLANIVWHILPDSLLVFKTIMFLSLFLTIVPIWLLVLKFYEERTAWIAVFLMLGLSPLLLFEFGQLENEIFAYPLLVWAVYFFLTKKPLLACLFSFVGTCFWVWPFYLTFFNNSSSSVVEMQMFSGLINLWFLLPVVFFIPLIKDRRVRLLGLLSVGLWLWNAKLFMFLLPFLALGIAELLRYVKNHTVIIKTAYYLAFFGLFAWNIAFLMQQPNRNDLFVVDEAIRLSADQNLPIYNDWSFGYWLWSEGIKAENNPGTGDVLNLDRQERPCIVISSKDYDCNLIYGKKEIARKETKLWQCN